jgi:hypothetical protein
MKPLNKIKPYNVGIGLGGSPPSKSYRTAPISSMMTTVTDNGNFFKWANIPHNVF